MGIEKYRKVWGIINVASALENVTIFYYLKRRKIINIRTAFIATIVQSSKLVFNFSVQVSTKSPITSLIRSTWLTEKLS